MALEDLWDTFVRRNSFRGQSRVLGALHHHDDHHEIALLRQISLTQLRQEQSIRSIDWLATHGYCLDHMTVGPSTIRQAGRGALATGFLPAESVVAPLPLIFMDDRERLRMYPLVDEHPDHDQSALRELPSYQLLLNYCMGHAESSLLLCPYGSLFLHVNQNQTLANVRLQWSTRTASDGTHHDLHNSSLLQQPIEILQSPHSRVRLAMELVATREIRPGEEIFLDYGDEWEQAWQHHLSTWGPVPGAETYLAAWQLNAQSSRIRTVFEEMDRSEYPSNVQLSCDSILVLQPQGWKDRLLSGTLARYLNEMGNPLWECDVLSYFELDGVVYYRTVLLQPHEDDADEGYHLVDLVPRESITFVDLPYTSDMFLMNAFRHDIRISDHLFPIAWQNLPHKRILEAVNSG